MEHYNSSRRWLWPRALMADLIEVCAIFSFAFNRKPSVA
jgi:hypothetical protein